MKSAIVTGGNNGLLGPVWVKALGDRSYHVDSFDVPKYDLAQPFDIKAFCLESKTPSVVVHNSAIDPKPGSPNGKDPFRQHADIMAVNHTGLAYMNSLLIPAMIANGGGTIVIIGSIMGYISANQENYSDGWTKALYRRP